MNKIYGILVVSVLFAMNLNAAKANDGTDAETSTIGLKSKYPFVDRDKMVVRGHIEYSVPVKRDDGIEVADARGLCDVDALIKFANELEEKNLMFKQGKGVRKKRGNSNRSPSLTGNIDSILIAKGGRLVFEEYFADANIDKPHYQMSITKSITASAIGKLIDMGKIESENDLILKYLPEVDRSKIAEGAENLTIKDLLTMSSGIRFKGNKAALRKIVTKDNCAELYLTYTAPIPDKKKYKYDGTNPSILQHIIFNLSGMNLNDFSEKYIFGPMGITDFSFSIDSCGLNSGAAGMKLRSRDMLKIGLMMNAGGEWNGEQILSKDWVERATKAYCNVDSDTHQYGYFWWGQNARVGDKVYAVKSARGAGGQFIFMVKDLDLVVVITSYYAKQTGIKLMETLILPSFVHN